MGSLGHATFTDFQFKCLFVLNFWLCVYSSSLLYATVSDQESVPTSQWNATDTDNNPDWPAFTAEHKNVRKHYATSDTIMDVGYHSLRRPQGDYKNCSLNKHTMDCSNCGLETVPKPLAPDIEYLDLSANFIYDLPDRVFVEYGKLLALNISSNKLTSLNNFSFYGLSQLTHLDLWNNSLLLLSTTYPVNVFVPLSNLVSLRISKNTRFCSDRRLRYPDKALAALNNLQYLYMDGVVYNEFGDGFQNLTRLTNLTLAGYLDGHCCLRRLSNWTFENLRNLTYLDLSNCNINGSLVDVGAFKPLTELEVLSLTHNENLQFDGLRKILHGLRKSNLKRLHIQLITDRYSFGFCLKNPIIDFLPETVEYLDVRENGLYAVDRHVIGKLPPGLKEMDLSGNMFGFATYFQDLNLMHNLTVVRLNGASCIYELPRHYPYKLTMAIENKSHACTPYSMGTDVTSNTEEFELSLPPNLKSIEMNNAGLRYSLTKLVVNGDNKLEMLSLHGNVFENLIGPLTGLHSLTHLDLSSCTVNYISNDFFAKLSSLQTLNLSYNSIGNLLSVHPEIKPFSTLSNLKTLTLSSNNIDTLPETIFTGVENLKFLILTDNPISNFSVDITNLVHLEVLNLSRTSLNKLQTSTRNHIDELLNQNVPIRVDMSKSPILCTCENLDFLEWLVASKAFSGTFSNYECVNPDSSRIYLKNGYNETLNMLRRQCPSHSVMFLIVTASTLALFSILLGLVIYRFRWKLRYFYYAAYVYCVKHGRKKDSCQFQYDVFVSYDHRDERFVRKILSPELNQRGLRLCIHDRDFTAGDYIASNIVNAICKSRRTLVVLTKHLINSYWCTYEIQMANMEAAYTGRQVLVFLLMEKIVDNIGTQLRYNISNNTYVAYPDDADVANRDLFWDKLALDLSN